MNPTTPILLIIFNRPDKVEKLIAALEKIKPSSLYIFADGPRDHVPSDKEKCEEARRIASFISWPCTIEKNFQQSNLGCRVGVSSAITWFFFHVDAGIILEDDCLPDPSFFPYCSELLDRYRDNEEIMHINGTTFLDENNSAFSYHFSRVDHVWGWATWRRAWNKYDIEMKNIETLSKSADAKSLFLKERSFNFWIDLFKHVRDKKIDTWDAQWLYTIVSNRGLAITPHRNLIQNIGFDNEATHTKTRDRNSNLVTEEIKFPLIHPKKIEANALLDDKLMRKVYLRSFWDKVQTALSNAIFRS
jgi:hypothetical protein